MSRHRRGWKRFTVVIAAVLLAAGVWQSPAGARDQGSRGTLSPDNRVVEEDFSAIPGIYPVRTGAHPFAGFRPPGCRNYNYCDTHEVEAALTPGYSEIYGIKVTLSWPNPLSENPTIGNQVTLHVWGDDDAALGGPAGPCSSPRDPNCMGEHPLSFSMVEPTVDPDAPVKFWITVVNSENVNQGYTLRLEWFEIDIDQFPEFADDRFRPRGPIGPPTTATTGRPPSPSLFAPEDDAPAAESRTILVPGPDGELMEIELPVVAAGTILRDDEGRGINPVITAVVVIIIVAGLITYLTIRRRRQAVT